MCLCGTYGCSKPRRHSGICDAPVLDTPKRGCQKRKFIPILSNAAVFNIQQQTKSKQHVLREQDYFLKQDRIHHNGKIYKAVFSCENLRRGHRIVSVFIYDDNKLICEGTFQNRHLKGARKEDEHAWAKINYDDGDKLIINIAETPTYYCVQQSRVACQANVPLEPVLDVFGIPSKKRMKLDIPDGSAVLLDESDLFAEVFYPKPGGVESL